MATEETESTQEKWFNSFLRVLCVLRGNSIRVYRWTQNEKFRPPMPKPDCRYGE